MLIQIPRPCDKKKVLFYYDHTTDLDLGDISHENSKCVENLMQNVIQYQLGKSSLFLECGYDEQHNPGLIIITDVLDEAFVKNNYHKSFLISARRRVRQALEECLCGWCGRGED